MAESGEPASNADPKKPGNVSRSDSASVVPRTDATSPELTALGNDDEGNNPDVGDDGSGEDDLQDPINPVTFPAIVTIPGGHDHNQVLSWPDYQANGLAKIAKLNDAITRNLPDVIKPSWKNNYEEEPVGGELKEPVSQSSGSQEKDPFKDPAISLNISQNWVQLTMYDPNFQRNDKSTFKKIVTQNSYSKTQKAIIVQGSYSANDQNKGAHRLYWSDLTFQRWKEVAGDDVKELRFVARTHIINQGTIAVVKQAYEEVGIGRTIHHAFSPSASNEKEKWAYFALSGTDQVKGIFNMLADHHQAFGNLTVVKIHVFPVNGPSSTMFIETGR